MKKVIFLFCFITSVSLFSQQNSINNYKYILVPTEFEFQKRPDQHQLNSLTKFLFKKNGFNVFFTSEELPEDLINNSCSALTVDVKNNSGVITTKNVIELKDCRGNLIFTSSEGKSRLKQYKRAYQESIKDAFNSIKALNYKYNGNEIKVKKKETPKAKVLEEVKKDTVIIKPTKTITSVSRNILYAQRIENGFQLVDTKPEVVLQVLRSSKKDFYFIKNKDGILFKKDNGWIAEYYENDKLVQKEYQIKF